MTAVANHSRREPAPTIEPVAVAMDALRRIVRSLRVAERHSEATLGLTSAQLFVLREIDKAGTLTVSDLAKRTATAQSSVSEVLTRLEARRLVTRTRSAADRRRAEITLSEAGRALLIREREPIQERLVGAFQALSIDGQRATAELLTEWVDEAGMGDVPASMFFEPLG